jgi:hypothetical protein
LELKRGKRNRNRISPLSVNSACEQFHKKEKKKKREKRKGEKIR